MNGKKVMGFAIVLLIAVPLMIPAFLKIGEVNPTIQLFAYVGMLCAVLIAGFLTNQGESESGH